MTATKKDARKVLTEVEAEGMKTRGGNKMRPSLKRIRDRVIEAMRASSSSPGAAMLLDELLKIDEQIQKEAARDLAFAGMREARSRDELVAACRKAQEAIHGGHLPKADFTNPPTSKE